MNTITAAAPSRRSCASSADHRRLPPGAHAWAAYTGRAGPLVAIGPDAFAIAARRWASYPVLVCPDGEDPLGFRWPVDGLPVLVLEAGAFDTNRLLRLVQALLRDGATLVVPLRQALLDATPPRSWRSYRPGDLAELGADEEAAHG